MSCMKRKTRRNARGRGSTGCDCCSPGDAVAPVCHRTGLGFVFGEGLGSILRRNPDTVRRPHVSVVRQEPVPAGGIPDGFWPGPPDGAVEIVSLHDRAEEVHEWVWAYLGAGVRQVWVVWPRSRAVTAYEAGGVIRELGAEEEREGGEVLPGFRIPVRELFTGGA